ncbi:Uncharacterized protein SCF082_LOCUS1028, partial [Durusdinium trenchii]
MDSAVDVTEAVSSVERAAQSFVTTTAVASAPQATTMTKNEPNDDSAVKRFQLSVTLNVAISSDARIDIALANSTGFFVAHEPDAVLQDGRSEQFEALRNQALHAVGEALYERAIAGHDQQVAKRPRSNVHQSDAGPPFVGTATLKVQGSAKELIRELTPQQLQHGDVDPNTGQQLTGLMLLVAVLARRYAPLEAENTTKSIAEFLSFRRQPGEAIDSVLVRFDILRNRANVRAGFAVNWTGLSWLLLQSLGLNAEMWDRLLAPLGGQMPQNEHELGGLMERIRRLFHLKEGRMQYHGHQGAMGDPGQFFTEGYFPTFAPEGAAGSAFLAGGPSPPDPWSSYVQSGHSPLNSSPDPNACCGPMSSHAFQADRADQAVCCPTCGMYFQDDGFSTDTSSDDGTEMMSDDQIDPSEAYLQYAFARKRWRRVSNKFPRRYRKHGKGSRGFGKGFKPSSYAAFLPPNAFAGGKGFGGGKKGGKQGFKRNPKDKNGQTLKCNICQSEEHLWRNCPKRNQQGEGTFATDSASGLPFNSGFASTNHNQLALVPSVLWGGSNQATALPGVHFFGTELENLRSVSENAASVVSATSSSRKRTPAERPEPSTPSGAPSKTVPRWSPSFFPDASAVCSAASSPCQAEVEPLLPDAPEPSSPPPQEPAPSRTFVLGAGSSTMPDPHVPEASPSVDPTSHQCQEDACVSQEKERVRDQSIRGLHNVLLGLGRQAEDHDAFQYHTGTSTVGSEQSHGPVPQQSNSATGLSSHGHGSGSFPWWEANDKPSESVSAPQAAYHLRTRRQNGEVGLLVDPGAHDNLIGEATAQQMCEELNTQLRLRNMDKPLPVEGVGKSAQVANKAACIPMAVMDVSGTKTDATYTAPIIQGSLLPPLLGNRTLRKMQVIMDCGTGKLIVPGPGSIAITISEAPRRAENLAWIFSDKAGLRQRLLQELNFRTVHFHYDLHSRSQCQKLLNELALQKPMLLWIRMSLQMPAKGQPESQDIAVWPSATGHMSRIPTMIPVSGLLPALCLKELPVNEGPHILAMVAFQPVLIQRRVDAEVQVETPGAASGSADGAVVIPAEGERGIAEAEIPEGGALRQVEISLPPGGEHLLRVIKGYEDFDPQREVLFMLKPGFGLKDAPRLWLMALKRVLAKIGVI